MDRGHYLYLRSDYLCQIQGQSEAGRNVLLKEIRIFPQGCGWPKPLWVFVGGA